MPRHDAFEMSDIASNNSRDDGSARRRSITNLSQDDAADGSLTAAEARLADRGFWRKSIVVITLIGLW
jgi:hypothetical protein